jgi:hypothetical protein
MSLPDTNIYYQGDSIDLEFQLYQDKDAHLYWNLTNHQIRFQLNSPTLIKKATANVTGGSDEQILIENAAQGLFLIMIDKTESHGLAAGDYNFEIEITTPSPALKRYTIKQGTIRILSDMIEWTNI